MFSIKSLVVVVTSVAYLICIASILIEEEFYFLVSMSLYTACMITLGVTSDSLRQVRERSGMVFLCSASIISVGTYYWLWPTEEITALRAFIFLSAPPLIGLFLVSLTGITTTFFVATISFFFKEAFVWIRKKYRK